MGGVRTIVYVDGFNLYYGALRGTPYKWLDLAALCRKLLRPEDEITAIKYFTAIVSARAGDPDAPVRQQMYIRALTTIPFLTVHYGHFLSHVVRMPLAWSLHTGRRARYVDVLKTEEKGSDVNLATHLLHDAHMDRFTLGVVVTNDSDLVEPIRIAREEIGKVVGILNPQKHPSRMLQAHGDFFKSIRSQLLRSSQFPSVMSDAQGVFRKPAAW